MYVVAVAMPEKPSADEKKAFGRFVRSLPFLLPCGVCRNEFAKTIEDSSPDDHTGSRTEMLLWVLNAHNSVRARQNKPPLQTSDVTKMIIRNHKRNQAWPPYVYVSLGMGLAFMLVAAFVAFKMYTRRR
jgi:hypothetical protein